MIVMVKLVSKGILKKTDRTIREVFEVKDPNEPQIIDPILIFPDPKLDPFLEKKVIVTIEIREIAVS